MIKYIWGTIAGAAAGMAAVAQPSMGVWEYGGRWTVRSRKPDPRPQTSASGRPRKGAAKGAKRQAQRAHGCPGGVDGVMELPDAIRSLSSNLPQ